MKRWLGDSLPKEQDQNYQIDATTSLGTRASGKMGLDPAISQYKLYLEKERAPATFESRRSTFKDFMQ